MEKSAVIKSRHRILEGESYDKFSKLVKDGIFKKYCQTKVSNFYRCTVCRICKVREILENQTFYQTKTHSKNCTYMKETKSSKHSSIDEKIFSIGTRRKVSSRVNNSVNCDDEKGFFKMVHERNYKVIQELPGDALSFNPKDCVITEYYKNEPYRDEYKKEKCLFKIAKVTPQELNNFSVSLDEALKVKKITFFDDLLFERGLSNIPDEYLETVITLSPENQNIFEVFKMKSRNKIYAPLNIVYKDENHGYVVKATRYISALTLICEYSGMVQMFNREKMENEDSIMEYVTFENLELVIVPNTFGNLARFISGINNSSKKKSSKKNLESYKFRIDNQIHIILYARRGIEKGETLYYDYNNGGLDEYQTSHFD